MKATGLPRVMALVAVVFWTAFGGWALLAPASFYEQVATFPPYNPHFLHDAGAFMLGLAATVALALRWSGALSVALAGTAVAGVLHAISHVVDREQGGSWADTLGLALLALLFVAAAWSQRRAETTAGRP